LNSSADVGEMSVVNIVEERSKILQKFGVILAKGSLRALPTTKAMSKYRNDKKNFISNDLFHFSICLSYISPVLNSKNKKRQKKIEYLFKYVAPE
jgi:hypothetical protein